jgi:hypothetical protein
MFVMSGIWDSHTCDYEGLTGCLLLLVHPVFWYSISLYQYIFTYERIRLSRNVKFFIQRIITPWEMVIVMFWPSQYQSFYCFVGYLCHSVVDVCWHFRGDVWWRRQLVPLKPDCRVWYFESQLSSLQKLVLITHSYRHSHQCVFLLCVY